MRPRHAPIGKADTTSSRDDARLAQRRTQRRRADLVLPVSAILGIVNTRIIIEHFGQAAYAQYGLLVGIGALLPFADLGHVGRGDERGRRASTTPRTTRTSREVLTTAMRDPVGFDASC